MNSAVVKVVVVAVMMVAVAEAQSIPSCASKLVPCADYLNSTNPPASCCDPLREAVTNELQCLCNLYNTPGLLQSFGLNLTQGVLLSQRCKVNGDLSACSSAGAPGPSGPSSVPPPPAAGGNDGNGVAKMSWTGMLSVLMILASMMLS